MAIATPTERLRRERSSTRSLHGPPGPEQLVTQVDEARAKLAILKPQERRALTHLAAGYTYLEIATMNRWTYTKVNRCISEGRAALRRIAA